MKKIILVSLAIILTLSQCTSTRQVMDSWLGKSGKSLMMNWGPPSRLEKDGDGGGILVYSKRIQMPRQTGIATQSNPNPRSYPGKVYWDYKMFWVNSEGIVYHWMTKRLEIPPQQVDLTIYF